MFIQKLHYKTGHIMIFRFLVLVLFLFNIQLSYADNIKVETIVQNICVACHAKDGNSIISANPKLSSQHESYLYKQLMNYKTGLRNNAVMSGIVSNLSEGELKALANYFSQQNLNLSKAIENGKG